ncbi:hypothetical protein J437_LFUL010557 [Ladona fulva]|uniref:YqaJ viral recombinase domain-containing protein n=1 Tax=Ladona fulva TaxID=123851 RepID=A0A8K0KE19_LADFU|nr:hypothetical protein J437_LFUL010557 [Ladona fulva]
MLNYPESKKRRKVQNSTGPKENYGLASTLPEEMPDISERQIAFLGSLRLSSDERDRIHKSTTDQTLNQTWKVERLKRLTSSMFGSVCKMKQSTSCAKKVIQVLSSNFSATQYGVEKEPLALVQERCNMKVTPTGLFIDEDKPYLAATPDGLVGEHGLVEIKCSYSVVKMSPAEGIASGRDKYCGQLHITRRKFYIFALWSPKGTLTQTIEKDDSFWNYSMESKLEKFYMECILSEIIETRYPRGLTIKEPNRVFN